MSGDVGIAAGNVTAAEDDAGIGLGWVQSEGNVFAAMQGGAAAIDGAFQGTLQGGLAAGLFKELLIVYGLFHYEYE